MDVAEDAKPPLWKYVGVGPRPKVRVSLCHVPQERMEVIIGVGWRPGLEVHVGLRCATTGNSVSKYLGRAQR